MADKSKGTLSLLRQARVPGSLISANRGVHFANRRILLVPRLDSVPESMINLKLGIG